MDTAGVNVLSGVPTAGSPLGVTAHVETASGVAVAGREVTFRVLQGGRDALPDDGHRPAPAGTPSSRRRRYAAPSGYFTVVASILGSDGQVSASDTALDVDTSIVAFQPSVTADLGIAAVVKDVERHRLGRPARSP